MDLQQLINRNRILLIIASAVLLVFLLANILLAVYVGNRTYPGVKVLSASVGLDDPQVVRKQLEQRTESYDLKLTVDEKQLDPNLDELGISHQIDKTLDSTLEEGRSQFIPVIGLFVSITDEPIEFELSVDSQKLQQYVNRLEDEVSTSPANAKLIYDDGIKIKSGSSGSTIKPNELAEKIKNAASTLDPQVGAKTVAIKPNITEEMIREQVLNSAQKKASLGITLNGPGESAFAIKPKTITTWLTVSRGDGDRLSLNISEDAVSSYAKSVAETVNRSPEKRVVTRRGGEVVGVDDGQSGIRVKQQDLTNKILSALQRNDSSEITIPSEGIKPETAYRDLPTKDQPQVTYTYCVVFRGVSRSRYYNEFSTKAAAILNADQGWSLDGRIKFSEVSSGCSFNLMLASPEEVAALAGYCSPKWSCRVGSIAAINVERWNNDTKSWTASLSSYRTMVINHEVGHWLGMDHRSCSGQGAVAPVMQQQSISLNGCKQNPWPTQDELATLGNIKGIN